MRQKFVSEGSDVQADSKTDKSQGAARAISSFIDPGLSWKDIPWFQSITKMPLILKGVQCWEVRRDCPAPPNDQLANFIVTGCGLGR